jgi:hypothetical protein
MARTAKIKRRWIKEEKQLVYLLYRKGFLTDFNLKDLYWESYYWYNKKCYKSKISKYRFPIYFPEVHFCTTDYWGESDEHSIVNHVKGILYWGNIDIKNWDGEEYPKSTFNKLNRQQFLKYLKTLPTKIGDKKINKILKRINEND